MVPWARHLRRVFGALGGGWGFQGVAFGKTSIYIRLLFPLKQAESGRQIEKRLEASIEPSGNAIDACSSRIDKITNRF